MRLVIESTIVTDASNKPFLPELEQYLTQFFAPTDAATISRQYFREVGMKGNALTLYYDDLNGT